MRVPFPQNFKYLNRFRKILISLRIGTVNFFPGRKEKHNFVIGKRPDILFCLTQRHNIMLNHTVEGINYSSIEKHGVTSDTNLPVAGYIHMKDFSAELLQRRPWTQAARQALPDNGAWGISGIKISTFCQSI